MKIENEMDLLEKIYSLSTESKLADERLEIQFSQINKRIETLENLSATMANNLNDIKHIQSVVDQLSNVVHQNAGDVKELKKKYFELELRPTKEKSAKWQQVIDGFFKAVLGAVIAWVLAEIGIVKIGG